MDFDKLHKEIKAHLYMYNSMTEEQADDYSWIAINQMKKHLGGEFRPFRPNHFRGDMPTSPATLAAKGIEI